MEYIISDRGKDSDPHWMRYSVACSPCLVSYDAIVKLETSEEDEVRKDFEIFFEYMFLFGLCQVKELFPLPTEVCVREERPRTLLHIFGAA